MELTSLNLTVIVPVYNGGDDIQQCLAALATSSRPADQIIVVDDCSTDHAAKIASEQVAAQYLYLADGPQGPARARNLGVAQAGVEVQILVFIDADVLVHLDTLEQIERQFIHDQHLAALFGSYDDQPHHPSAISRYRNLLHHHVHQNSSPEAKTFWAGCGAVRAHSFNAVGGFSQSYARPSIEDIEFGARLHEHGHHIKLCRDIQVTHLKRWTLSNMIRTDVFARAIPWTRLLHKDPSHAKDLNLSNKSRAAALLALLFVASLLLLPFSPVAGLVSVFLAALFITMEYSFFKLLMRNGGLPLAAAGFLLHVLYYCYASGAFVLTKMVLMYEERVGPINADQQGTPSPTRVRYDNSDPLPARPAESARTYEKKDSTPGTSSVRSEVETEL